MENECVARGGFGGVRVTTLVDCLAARSGARSEGILSAAARSRSGCDTHAILAAMPFANVNACRSLHVVVREE